VATFIRKESLIAFPPAFKSRFKEGSRLHRSVGPLAAGRSRPCRAGRNQWTRLTQGGARFASLALGWYAPRLRREGTAAGLKRPAHRQPSVVYLK
jgi:hypothetical protein